MTKAWGVKSRNDGQTKALKYLMDPSIDLVILQGIAGSGKTLLALAAGLEQVIENRIYKEIIFTRAPVPVGDDMGFLPGEIEEKLLPWMGALTDNLEMLIGDSKVTEAVISTKVKTMAMMHLRGRSLNNRYVILDETQNLSMQQLKVIITRCGENSKIICLGDLQQIDNKKLNKDNNGLAILIKAAANVDFIKLVELPDGVRSRLATWGAVTL